MTKRKIMKRRRQRTRNRRFICIIFINLLIVFIIMLGFIIKSNEVSGNNENEDESNSIVYESETNDHDTETSSANASNETLTPMPEVTIEIKFSRNLSENDKYLLAKMAMAEAEGESVETKVYVILTILNRVNSKYSYFPDTIEEVLFQHSGKIYQFSPMAPGGRWWRVEPNSECWEAVEIVNEMEYDISMGALYFESCKGESWHSKNLEFLFQSDNMRFYK